MTKPQAIGCVFGITLLLGAACSSDGGDDSPAGGSAGYSASGGAAGSGGSSGTGGVGGGAGSPDTDGGGDDSGDASQAGVVGQAIDTYVTSSGSTPSPADLSKYEMAALVYNTGSSSFATHAPTITGAGTFHFPSVPAGEYYLRFYEVGGVPSYYVSSARNIDLGRYRLGRPDLQPAQAGTTLVFNLAGLNAWQDGDALDAFSLGAAVHVPGMEGAASAGAPVVGDEQVSDLSIDYAGSALPPNLIDGSKGDRVIVKQLVVRPLSGAAAYVAVAKATELPAFTQTDGQLTTIAGTLSPVPQTNSVGVDVKFSQFHALWRQANPEGTAPVATVVIWAQPEIQAGFIGPAPDLVRFDPPDENDWVTSLTFGNPYPSSYGLGLLVRVGFARAFSVGSASPTTVRAGAELWQSVDASQTLAPLVGTVQNLRIGDADGLANVSSAGTQPRVSWSPPALGTPTSYEVTVTRLFRSGDVTMRARAGSIVTAGTGFVMPPGIMSTGNSYVLRVSAALRQGTDFESRPFATTLPETRADVVSGLITP